MWSAPGAADGDARDAAEGRPGAAVAGAVAAAAWGSGATTWLLALAPDAPAVLLALLALPAAAVLVAVLGAVLVAVLGAVMGVVLEADVLEVGVLEVPGASPGGSLGVPMPLLVLARIAGSAGLDSEMIRSRWPAAAVVRLPQSMLADAVDAACRKDCRCSLSGKGPGPASCASRRPTAGLPCCCSPTSCA